MALHFTPGGEALPVLRPRERLATYGPQALADWELLALLLRVGERRAGVQLGVEELSRLLLADMGLRGLFMLDDVAKAKDDVGMYTSHAETIVAVGEIGRRISPQRDVFDASDTAALAERYAHLRKAKFEQCFVLCLNAEHRCTYQQLVAMGTADQVSVSTSDVLRYPIWLGSSGMVVVHNHPGTCQPSLDDRRWTAFVADSAWRVHGITLRDHLIIGQDGYFSFRDEGLL